MSEDDYSQSFIDYVAIAIFTQEEKTAKAIAKDWDVEHEEQSWSDIVNDYPEEADEYRELAKVAIAAVRSYSE